MCADLWRGRYDTSNRRDNGGVSGASVSTPGDLEKRIIGGQECGPNDREYHVKLIGNDGTSNFLCGGSLISKDWILTAAHCDKKTITAYVGIHPSGGGGGQATEAKHETFIDKQSNKHDIMLLKLQNPVTTVKPVGLPNCKTNPAKFLRFFNKYGAKVQVAGHGPATLGPNGLRG
ncbi:thrombin-like enzyme gyroxin B2.1 [Halichoeres trimaculatus]|uniref:thrombin-like enzyme gyroxin B2.1 n=1 Tax=Halichoeres trimaculatus TaxID=147232 RepID=UPI003D9FA7FA